MAKTLPTPFLCGIFSVRSQSPPTFQRLGRLRVQCLNPNAQGHAQTPPPHRPPPHRPPLCCLRTIFLLVLTTYLLLLTLLPPTTYLLPAFNYLLPALLTSTYYCLLPTRYLLTTATTATTTTATTIATTSTTTSLGGSLGERFAPGFALDSRCFAGDL